MTHPMAAMNDSLRSEIAVLNQAIRDRNDEITRLKGLLDHFKQACDPSKLDAKLINKLSRRGGGV